MFDFSLYCKPKKANGIHKTPIRTTPNDLARKLMVLMILLGGISFIDPSGIVGRIRG